MSAPTSGCCPWPWGVGLGSLLGPVVVAVLVVVLLLLVVQGALVVVFAVHGTGATLRHAAGTLLLHDTRGETKRVRGRRKGLGCLCTEGEKGGKGCDG